MRIIRLVSVAAVLATSVITAAPAQAAPTQAADYGQHVKMCAHMMGFDGDHNPGMHQGQTNWDPVHTCMMS